MWRLNTLKHIIITSVLICWQLLHSTQASLCVLKQYTWQCWMRYALVSMKLMSSCIETFLLASRKQWQKPCLNVNQTERKLWQKQHHIFKVKIFLNMSSRYSHLFDISTMCFAWLSFCFWIYLTKYSVCVFKPFRPEQYKKCICIAYQVCGVCGRQIFISMNV